MRGLVGAAALHHIQNLEEVGLVSLIKGTIDQEMETIVKDLTLPDGRIKNVIDVINMVILLVFAEMIMYRRLQINNA